MELRYILLSILTLSNSIAFVKTDYENPYKRREQLDNEGKYILEWTVVWENKEIYVNLTTKTLGYIGFGLNKNPEMAGADIVIGGVDSDGKPYLHDMHAIKNAKPPEIDKKQNWILKSAWENETHTSLRFSRKLDTCDKEDFPLINDDTVFIIWAYGETDDLSKSHGKNRGSLPRVLLLPTYIPRGIASETSNLQDHEGNLTIKHRPFEGNPYVKIWSIRSTFKLPPKRTTYWCQLVKLELAEKHHVIGFDMIINKATQQHIHHTLLFRCIESADPLHPINFEDFINQGEECYSQLKVKHKKRLPLDTCVEMKAGESFGGGPTFYPPTAGSPIGTHKTEYYMLQIHFDNPEERDDLVSESQLDTYYTAKLRPNVIGMMPMGHGIPGSPSLLLPPKSPSHLIYGHCSDSCTRRMLPLQGIHIVSVVLHAHDATGEGAKIYFQHFRNGVELPPITKDDNWSFSYQLARMLRKPVLVLPGDYLVMRCDYNTSSKGKTTVGGFGTDQEMCNGFVSYYNFLDDHVQCFSEIELQSYNDKYLGGARDFYWNETLLEMVARGGPQELQEKTVSEIAELVNGDWSEEQKASLQNDHFENPQDNYCASLLEAQLAGEAGTIPPPFLAKHPMNFVPYKPPPRECCGLK